MTNRNISGLSIRDKSFSSYPKMSRLALETIPPPNICGKMARALGWPLTPI